MNFKSSKKILLRLVSVAVGIALMAYLYSKTDGEFTALVTSMNFETLVILISAYSGILIIDIIRLIIILHPSRKSIDSTAIRGSIIAPSLNMLLPGRAGDLNALVSSRSSDWPIGQRTRNLVLLRLTDLIVLAVIGTLLAASFIDFGFTIAIIIAAVFACAGVYVTLPHLVGKFAAVLKLPIGDFKPEQDHIALRRFILTGISSIMFWAIQGLFTYLILRSFGIGNIGMLAVIAAVAAANLSKIVPITPGGVGIYENTLALALAHVGDISAEMAASAALVDGVLRYVLTASMPWLGLAFNASSISEEEEGEE